MIVLGLQSADQGAAAQALTDAFQRDPLSQWIHPESEQLESRMGVMFAGLLAEPPPGAVIEVTGDIDAVAIWLPPDSVVHSPPPPDTRPEVEDLFRRINEAAPEQPFWYLMFLGARTPGAGGGSALLSRSPGRPSALWTASEQNVGFYESHGYRVLSRHDTDGASAWWMWHDD